MSKTTNHLHQPALCVCVCVSTRIGAGVLCVYCMCVLLWVWVVARALTRSRREGAPPGSVGKVSVCGWIDRSPFVEWIAHIAKDMNTS